MKIWYLEGLYGPRRNLQRIRLSGFPIVVGRLETLPLVVDSPGISRKHARFLCDDEGELYLEDLGSTNGTFVNRIRLEGRQQLHNGDIVHFAESEFRVVTEAKSNRLSSRHTQQGIRELSADLPQGVDALQALMAAREIYAVFQPILNRRGELHAHEMLGRGSSKRIEDMPTGLFNIAESIDAEVELSELMREIGFETAAAASPHGRFFANTHPQEIEQPDRLIEHMAEIVNRHPGVQPVLEVHEGAIADRSRLEHLHRGLAELRVGVAYDDFGTGQSRLVELVDVPPDYIKLDMALIYKIHEASHARQRMVGMVLDYARERGILTVAEGITFPEEAEYCRQAGVDYLQGYYFGHPRRLEAADD